MDTLLETISRMPLDKALSRITEILGHLLTDLDNESRERFMMNLIEQSQGDKVSGMVHL